MSWTQVQEIDTTVEEVAGDIKIVEKLVEEVNKPKKLKAIKPKVSVLEEAQTIIYGDREKTYGHPAKNLKTIANMWNAYMNNMDDGNFTITAKDVAAMMMLVKVARFANDPSHRDNLVDVCGYAALIERCDEVKP
jgi:Domain of unknown function (DUF6378)